MYTLIRDSVAGKRVPSATTSTTGRRWRGVSGTVVLLGLTSFFTDISSEMVASVLPLYFVYHVGVTPLYFGLIDGLYQGISAPMALLGGYFSDRLRRHKDVAAAGYSLSAICRLGLLIVGAVPNLILGILLVDRLGKGLRTGPRDAMISYNSATDSLGMSFGVHRALDTVGALIGPLVAFGILHLLLDPFDTIFVISFCFGIIGVGIITLLVPAQRGAVHEESTEDTRTTDLSALKVLLTRRFWPLIVIALLCSVFTISDAFMFLLLQNDTALGLSFFPLLYVGTAMTYFAFAVPAGWLADRVGRGRVMVSGYIMLLLAYGVLLQNPGDSGVIVVVGMLGLFYAATDGVLMALASQHLPINVRASGLTVVASFVSLGRLGGSLIFGWLWTTNGAEDAVRVFSLGLAAAIVATMLLLRHSGNRRLTPSAGVPA